MGKSQTKRLREAARRFGWENWRSWYNARTVLSTLAYRRKMDAGLIAPVVVSPAASPANVKRYSTSLTYLENEDKFGRPRK